MVQFNWKGTWLPNLPYNENVVVEYNNVNYISNQFVPPTDTTPYYDTLHWDEMLVIFNTPTPTPSVTPEVTVTPTPSVTPEATPSSTPEPSVTPTPDATPPPTPSVTAEITPNPTPTNTETPTTTPTPTASPLPVTGYGYNLVVLPYQPPTSGNTIFPAFSIGVNSGTTNPNTFNVDGVYWNEIDNLGFNRLSYYSGMTGISVTAYFTQNGDTVIYSGSSTAFTIDGPPGQETFNYNPSSRPNQLTLIQSASTNFVTGQTVYISYITN